MSTLELSLTEGQKKELLSFYLAKKTDLVNQLKEIDGLISQLSVSPQLPLKPSTQESIFDTIKPPINTSSIEYKSNWSWAMKAKYAIKQEGKCLTTRGIIDAIRKIDPEEIGNPINSISGTLSGKIAKGVMFNRYQPYEGADYYIGLREWFDSEGTIKEQYRGFE